MCKKRLGWCSEIGMLHKEDFQMPKIKICGNCGGGYTEDVCPACHRVGVITGGELKELFEEKIREFGKDPKKVLEEIAEREES